MTKYLFVLCFSFNPSKILSKLEAFNIKFLKLQVSCSRIYLVVKIIGNCWNKKPKTCKIRFNPKDIFEDVLHVGSDILVKK